MDNQPPIFQDSVDARIQNLHRLLEEPTSIMQSALDRAIKDTTITNQERDRLFSVITAQYEQIQSTLETFSSQVLPGAYASGAEAGKEVLRQYGQVVYAHTVDVAAVNVLIRDMHHDFSRAIENGRESIGTYFKFSKQGRLTETEISEAVAKGLLDGGTGWEAKREMRKAIKERGTQIFDQASLDAYIRKKVLQGYEQKLLDGKVMQLINKNGKVMNFRVDSYSDLVSRTRIGEAQVAGTIDATQANGINLFKVTSHNTQSVICAPHEGKIYSSDPNDPKYEYLYGYGEHGELNKPVYHPRCLHRLMPYVDVSDIKMKPLKEFAA